MVRYAREHRETTRRRIIETAGPRLKRDGIDGSGVATLMSDAGLTNGAFYTHFESKDALVAEAITHQLQVLNDRMAAQVDGGRSGINQFVRWYLSPEHRDDPSDGCPNAALLDEIGRSASSIREAYTTALVVVADALASRFSAGDAEARRLRALGLMGLLAGTLQFARAVTDRELSDRLLEQGVLDAGALLDAAGESA